MKIFGIEFGGKTPAVRTEPQAFSTPFLKIGKGNLALPYIQSNISNGSIIYFGEENLFPQILNQMYYTSPIHGAIIDFCVKATIGGGYEIDGIDSGKQRVDFEVFKRKVKLPKMVNAIARDYQIHRRVHVILTFSDSGKWLAMKRVDPSCIRYRFDGDFEYSSDWSVQQNRRIIAKYNPMKPCGEMLYTYGEPGAGQDYYPIPTYSSCLNWVFLDGEQSLLHKSNIQNSIFPSLIIRRPKRFGSKKEAEDFKDGIAGASGSSNAGKVMVLTGDGMENTPEAQTVSSNNNDKLFESTAKEIKDNICFAHKINPSIMGIKVQGSLGNAQELEMSYAIYEKNVILPEREENEDIWSELMQIAEVEAKLNLKGFKIIGDNIVDGEESKVNKTGELLNAMSPLLANKVLENLTINEIRKIAGLPNVADGDKLASPTPPQITPAP
jgi:hypothetical protein